MQPRVSTKIVAPLRLNCPGYLTVNTRWSLIRTLESELDLALRILADRYRHAVVDLTALDHRGDRRGGVWKALWSRVAGCCYLSRYLAQGDQAISFPEAF